MNNLINKTVKYLEYRFLYIAHFNGGIPKCTCKCTHAFKWLNLLFIYLQFVYLKIMNELVFI